MCVMLPASLKKIKIIYLLFNNKTAEMVNLLAAINEYNIERFENLSKHALLSSSLNICVLVNHN